MAYFGRKPEKPGTSPGSQSGFQEQAGTRRVARRVLRVMNNPRPERGSKAGRATRAARNTRSGRSAR